MYSHPFGRLFLLIQHNINKATLIGLYDYFESSRPLMRADIDAITGNDVQTGDSGTFSNRTRKSYVRDGSDKSMSTLIDFLLRIKL